MRLATRGLTTVACALACLSGPARCDDALHQRLLAEAFPAWAELERAGTQMEGTYTLREEFRSPKINKPPTFKHCTIAINGELGKVSCDLGETSPPQQVSAINPNYVFQIARKKSSSDFRVNFLEPGAGEGDSTRRQMIKDMVKNLKNDIYCAWYLWTDPVGDLLKDPGTVIKAVEPVAREGRHLVRVRYEWSPKSGDKVKGGLRDGEIILDPAARWTIQQYKVSKFWGKIEATLSYGDPVDGLPFVREKTEVWSNDEGDARTRTLRFESLAKKKVPESEFKLSAYGLPEPNFDSRFNASFFYWYFALSVILGVLAVLLWRKRAKSPEPAA